MLLSIYTVKFKFNIIFCSFAKQRHLLWYLALRQCSKIGIIINNIKMDKSSASNIKVFCRFRPFNAQELANNAEKIHRIHNKKQLIIKDSNRQEISFMFDHVFETTTTQEEVYRTLGQPVLENILSGFNGTIMAYGQTSSGKTHTMQGHDVNDKDIKGLIPRIVTHPPCRLRTFLLQLRIQLKVWSSNSKSPFVNSIWRKSTIFWISVKQIWESVKTRIQDPTFKD